MYICVCICTYMCVYMCMLRDINMLRALDLIFSSFGGGYRLKPFREISVTTTKVKTNSGVFRNSILEAFLVRR